MFDLIPSHQSITLKSIQVVSLTILGRSKRIDNIKSKAKLFMSETVGDENIPPRVEKNSWRRRIFGFKKVFSENQKKDPQESSAFRRPLRQANTNVIHRINLFEDDKYSSPEDISSKKTQPIQNNTALRQDSAGQKTSESNDGMITEFQISTLPQRNLNKRSEWVSPPPSRWRVPTKRVSCSSLVSNRRVVYADKASSPIVIPNQESAVVDHEEESNESLVSSIEDAILSEPLQHPVPVAHNTATHEEVKAVKIQHGIGALVGRTTIAMMILLLLAQRITSK